MPRTRNGNGQKKIDLRKKYKGDETLELVHKLITSTGANEMQICDFLDITFDCFQKWKQRYPDFRSAVQEAKDIFDSYLVEGSLLQRAMGYEYDEVTEERIPYHDKKGKEKVKVVRKVVHKKMPPNVRAIELWLHNRHKDRWQATLHLKHEGQINKKIDIKQEVTLDSTPETRATILDILLKAGAIRPPAQKAIDTEAHEVHPPRTDF